MKLSTNFAHRMFFFCKKTKNLAQATTTNYLEFIYSMYKPCDFTFYKSLVPKKHVSSTTINSVWKKIILSSTGNIPPIILWYKIFSSSLAPNWKIFCTIV